MLNSELVFDFVADFSDTMIPRGVMPLALSQASLRQDELAAEMMAEFLSPGTEQMGYFALTFVGPKLDSEYTLPRKLALIQNNLEKCSVVLTERHSGLVLGTTAAAFLKVIPAEAIVALAPEIVIRTAEYTAISNWLTDFLRLSNKEFNPDMYFKRSRHSVEFYEGQLAKLRQGQIHPDGSVYNQRRVSSRPTYTHLPTLQGSRFLIWENQNVSADRLLDTIYPTLGFKPHDLKIQQLTGLDYFSCTEHRRRKLKYQVIADTIAHSDIPNFWFWFHELRDAAMMLRCVYDPAAVYDRTPLEVEIVIKLLWPLPFQLQLAGYQLWKAYPAILDRTLKNAAASRGISHPVSETDSARISNHLAKLLIDGAWVHGELIKIIVDACCDILVSEEQIETRLSELLQSLIDPSGIFSGTKSEILSK